MAQHTAAGSGDPEDIEVPARDRQEQQLPPPPGDRALDEIDVDGSEADQLDQQTPVRGADEPGRIEPGDETDGGI